jgi:hypothetical protein
MSDELDASKRMINRRAMQVASETFMGRSARTDICVIYVMYTGSKSSGVGADVEANPEETPREANTQEPSGAQNDACIYIYYDVQTYRIFLIDEDRMQQLLC